MYTMYSHLYTTSYMSQTKGVSLKKKSANDPLLDSVAPDKSNLSFIVIFLVIQAQKYGVVQGVKTPTLFQRKVKVTVLKTFIVLLPSVC